MLPGERRPRSAPYPCRQRSRSTCVMSLPQPWGVSVMEVSGEKIRNWCRESGGSTAADLNVQRHDGEMGCIYTCCQSVNRSLVTSVDQLNSSLELLQ